MPEETKFANEIAEKDELFDRIAAELYNLASMLVGEGEDGARLVETAIATAELPNCHDPVEGNKSCLRALSAAALEMIEQNSPGSLAAPKDLAPAGVCIDEEDLKVASAAREEFERMIAGPDRERVRKWLSGLSAAVRTVFVLRAVAGFTAAEIAGLLATHGGPQAAGWTEGMASQYFYRGLCSLASQLIHNSTARVPASGL
jgi:hypothetical protein